MPDGTTGRMGKTMNDVLIQIELNGEPKEVAAGTTLADLVEAAGIQGRRYAVEINGEIRPRVEHAETAVEPGDRVEIVQAIGGG